MRILLNQYRPDRGSLHVLKSRSSTLKEILRACREGLRVFVTCSSRKTATKVFKELVSRYPDRKYLLVTRDTGDASAVKAFHENPSAESLKYDGIIASPSVGTGIDLSFDHDDLKFDIVFGIFDVDTLTHFDIAQQLARNRNPKMVRIYITPKINHSSIGIEVITNELAIGDLPYLRDRYDATGKLHMREGYEDDDLWKIAVSARVTEIASKNRLKTNTLLHLEREGYQIAYAEDAGGNSDDDESLQSSLGSCSDDANIDTILRSPNMEELAYEQLKGEAKEGRVLTPEEIAALKKTRLQLFYRRKLDADLIREDADGVFQPKVRTFELLSNHDLLTMRRKTGSVDIWDKHYRALKSPIAKEVLIEVLLETTSLYKLGTFLEDQEVTGDLPDLENMLEALRPTFECQFDRSSGTDHIKTLKHILGHAGLTLDVRKSEVSGKTTRYYRLRRSSLQRMQEIRDRRRSITETAYWRSLIAP